MDRHSLIWFVSMLMFVSMAAVEGFQPPQIVAGVATRSLWATQGTARRRGEARLRFRILISGAAC